MFSCAVGREEHCKQISLAYEGNARNVWVTLGLPHSRRVCFPSLHCSGSRLLCRLNCLKWDLGCIHFPGLSCSGSASQVLHKGTDSVGPAFCALSRPEQLRRPGAWRVHSPHVGRCILSPPSSQALGFLGAQQECCLRWVVCLI